MPEQRNPALLIEQVSLDQLRAIAASGDLYAVADATDTLAVPKKVLELGPERAVSLYRGTAEEEFWEVAPYLIHVDPPVLDWILSTLDITRWGIFAISKADLKTLRTHFRHFLKVQPPEGDPWFFRFYDPRVIGPFLSACNSGELRMFFGPTLAYSSTVSELGVTVFLEEAAAQTRKTESASPPNYSLIFRLREPHLKGLEPQADCALAAEVIEFLRVRFPELIQDLPQKALEARVLLGFRRARKYGFTRTSTLAAFVGIMLEVGPRFDEHPFIHAALVTQEVPADDRWNLMLSRTRDTDWDSARHISWPQAWEKMLGGTA